MILPSVSTALVLSVAIGVFEAAAMYFGSGVFLSMMGISSVSSTFIDQISQHTYCVDFEVDVKLIYLLFSHFGATKDPY